MNCKSLRKEARESLNGKWGIAVLVFLIYSGIVGSIEIFTYSGMEFFSFAGSVGYVAIAGPLLFGFSKVYLNIARRENPNVGQLFSGFSSNMWRIIGAWALTSVYTFLWSLLFIIPGIIASYRYAMTYYVMVDNPNIGPRAAIEKSKEIMNGNKARLFRLDLSFIGWYLLGILSLGVGFIWITPYTQAARAEFYKDLVKNTNENNETSGTIDADFSTLTGVTASVKNEADVAPFRASEDASVVEEEKQQPTNENVVYSLKCDVCGATEVHKEKTATCSYCGGIMK